MRLQDFKRVTKYNYALFKISSQLKLCGENVTKEDMLEKHILHFLPRMCSCNSNIESVISENNLN